mmetsp:Transcript_33128/g.95600  ORF Transcript_33128/g.95600 Transcript_33128/m.95600 type:complete len:248 (+) Transcript_33128:321-1064(+)
MNQSLRSNKQPYRPSNRPNTTIAQHASNTQKAHTTSISTHIPSRSRIAHRHQSGTSLAHISGVGVAAARWLCRQKALLVHQLSWFEQPRLIEGREHPAQLPGVEVIHTRQRLLRDPHKDVSVNVDVALVVCEGPDQPHKQAVVEALQIVGSPLSSCHHEVLGDELQFCVCPQHHGHVARRALAPTDAGRVHVLDTLEHTPILNPLFGVAPEYDSHIDGLHGCHVPAPRQLLAGPCVQLWCAVVELGE